MQLQNMLIICLYKNIQRSKFHDLTYALGSEFVEGMKKVNEMKWKNDENFEFVPFRLRKLLT